MTEMTAQHQGTLEWTLGDRLAKARKVAGLTQQEMADRLLVSRQTVNTWENDAHRPPARKVAAWALATGVDFVWITSGGAGSISTGDRNTGWFPRHRVVDIGRRVRRRVRRRRPMGHPHNHPGLSPIPDPRQHARHLHSVPELVAS